MIIGSSGETPQDADVGRFLNLFTDLSFEDIGKLESLEGAEINQAKIVLATEATAMLHGREAAPSCPTNRAKRLSQAAGPAKACRRFRSATA